MMRLRRTSSRLNWTAAAALAALRVVGLDRPEDFALGAQQDHAPAALHPAGELGGGVLRAAGHPGDISPPLPVIESGRITGMADHPHTIDL